MDNVVLPRAITNCIPNEIYREIILYNPRMWFGVNKQLHDIAEKLYYLQPKVVSDITHGRSLLHIITSNSLKGLSSALRVYQGTSTLHTYSHSSLTGERFGTTYNLLSYIMFPTARYHPHMQCWDADPKLKSLETKIINPDKVKMFTTFVELFPQERLLVDDILDFIKEFIERWSSGLDPKWINTYMDVLLTSSTIKSVVANNVQLLLGLASRRKHMFEYLIKCEFVTTEDKSTIVSRNLSKSSVGSAIKDLDFQEAIRLLSSFREGDKLNPNIIKAILKDHPFPDLSSINRVLDLETDDVTMRDKFWSLSMDPELAVILEERFPVDNRLSYYRGESLATANYLLKLDLRDDTKAVIDNMNTYLMTGDIIYKALVQNEITKAELIKNHHKYMLQLLSCKNLRCKVVIALVGLVPKTELDAGYLDMVYSKRTVNMLKTLLPYLGGTLSKNVFVAGKGKHVSLLKSHNIKIVPALTDAEKTLFNV